MPAYLPPNRIGSHRIACLALYRALLTQCAHIPIPKALYRGPINPLKHEIRKQFRRNRNDTSKRFVTTALRVGYEAEALLHEAATGSSSALQEIHTYLSNLKAKSTQARAISKPPPPPQRQPSPYPSAPSTLTVRPRPTSDLHGKKRKIPKLVSVMNYLPLLRFKKPQPAFLNRVIKDKIKAKNKTNIRFEGLEMDLREAKWEEDWEGSLRRFGVSERGGGVKGEEVEGWVQVVKDWKKSMMLDIDKIRRKNQEMARKMLDVIDKEKVLAEEERKQRVMARNAARREARGQLKEKTDEKVPDGDKDTKK